MLFLYHVDSDIGMVSRRLRSYYSGTILTGEETKGKTELSNEELKIDFLKRI